MSSKKVLLKGPFLSRSGYGYQARFALRALREYSDAELYLVNITWGNTSWIYDDSEERDYIDKKIIETNQYVRSGGRFDLSLQISIPNEIKNLARYNIMYTAGIETTRVAPQWLEKANEIDKLIVVSEHSKEVFEATKYDIVDETQTPRGTLKLEVPVDAVNYGVDKVPSEPLSFDLGLDHDFNFLAVAQWSPRKDLESTVTWFFEEFKDDEVGLVLKTSIANNSLRDRRATEDRLNHLTKRYKDAKCNLHLIHGSMTDGEMRSLYEHEKIKALVSTTHGEGFGLPLFEAAHYGLPVLAPHWSGQRDFLTVLDDDFEGVAYTLGKIGQEAVWEGVLQSDSKWAYALKGSFTELLRDVYKNYEKHKERAEKLKNKLEEEFKLEDQYKKFVDSINSVYELSGDEIDSWLKEMKVYD